MHQFYNEISLRDPSARVFSSLDMSEHQFISAILIDYVFRMGVDPRFVSAAASTPPLEMKFLDEQTLESLKVRWNPKEFEPWSIEPRGAGVIAITRSRDRTKTATFGCYADGIPRLTIEDQHFDRIGIEWIKDAMKVIEGVQAFDLNFPKDVLQLQSFDGAPVLQFDLRGVDGRTIATADWAGVSVDGPRLMLRVQGLSEVGVALRLNCRWARSDGQACGRSLRHERSGSPARMAGECELGRRFSIQLRPWSRR